MERKEGGRGGEKMSRQCPLCLGWVSPRAFVMLYTDPLSKVAMWLPVQLFSYSVSASFLSLLCDFLKSVTGGQIITRGQQITHRKRQNKWEAAKILILIRIGEVDFMRMYNHTSLSELSANRIKKEKRNCSRHTWHQMTLIADVISHVTEVESLSRVTTWGGGEPASPAPWRLACSANSRVNEEGC